MVFMAVACWCDSADAAPSDKKAVGMGYQI